MGFKESLTVGDRQIGPGYPCFIIAEIGLNHCGSIELAQAFVDAAAEAKVDAVKFQTLAPREMYAPDNPRLKVMASRAWAVEQYVSLKARAEERGLVFFSTAFDIPEHFLTNRKEGM